MVFKKMPREIRLLGQGNRPNRWAIINYSRMSPGFNLVELMATVSIICIIMVLGGAYSNSSYYKLRAAAHSVSATLQKSRLEAIKRNRNVLLDFDSNDDDVVDNHITIWMDLNSNGVLDGATELIETVPLDGGASLGSAPSAKGGPTKQRDGTTNIPSNGISVTDKRVTFKPDGTTSSAVVIFLHSPDHADAGTYEIDLNSVGQSKIWYYQPGLNSWKER